MSKLSDRIILVSLAFLFLWISSLILDISTEGWIFHVKIVLAVTVLLLICLSWVCFTLWCMIEIYTFVHLIEKTFKKVVDSINRKR